MKRSRSPPTIENPFIKSRNKDWRVESPSSFSARVSPPPTRRKDINIAKEDVNEPTPTTAAVEAGKTEVEDPVAFFSSKLLDTAQARLPGVARLSHEEWLDNYQRNQHANGRHFVVHQHDHPVAGTHYDLRLQCNATSSISWAVMYGLPGDPNSRRLNRNATETRIHNVWNHLIETASHSTGSMLIWDTGEYSVLPYRERPQRSDSDASDIDGSPSVSGDLTLTDCEKLHQAFSQRKVRLRLHGTRLPQNYTLAIRASKDEFYKEQPRNPARKRRRSNPKALSRQTPLASDSDDSDVDSKRRRKEVQSLHRTASPPRKAEANEDTTNLASDDDESETIRLTNAYTGATNDIGSVHQRKWYLSMDRQSSGFVPMRNKSTGATTWIRKRGIGGALEGFEKFSVMGRDFERSVVTGRLAKDIMKDEGVEGFVPRGLWRPVTE